MATSEPGVRVVVAVQPRLYADVLVRLLEEEGLDVVIYPERSGLEAEAGAFDVAVVSAAVPGDVAAYVVIRLPATATAAGTGSVRVGGQEHPVDIAGPRMIIDLVERFREGGRDARRQ